MPWWRRKPTPPDDVSPLDALTAAAKVIEQAREKITPKNETWQQEAWAFYDSLAEFGYAVDWRAGMTSRCRLRAGRIEPGLDEPAHVEDGLPADLVNEMFGGVGGVGEALETLSVHIGVPGESWVVTEKRSGVEKQRVYSTDEIRRKAAGWEVLDDDDLSGREKWRPLGAESLVCRVWEPSKRKRMLADSTARRALPVMRELELANRKITAEYLSRLASAGMVVFPAEMMFPVRPEFADEPDPFVAEWIATAREAIATPGTAAATVPIPVKMPAEYAEKLPKFIDFTLKSDDKILEKRDSAIRRLATRVNVPAEILLGISEVNHWTAWAVDEQAIKAHIAPHIEKIVAGLTIGYLWPRLKADGVPDFEQYAVWYDASEITQRPDRSEGAAKAYDRFELSGSALRREMGFGDDDEPTGDELREQLYKRMVQAGEAVALTAVSELTGQRPEVVDTRDDEPAAGASTDDEPEDERRIQGPPEPEGGDTAAPDAMAAAVDQATEQAAAAHRISVNPITGEWDALHHPPVCQQRLFTCPFTHAVARTPPVVPGKAGDYECHLSAEGRLIVGYQVFDRVSAGFVESTYRPAARHPVESGGVVSNDAR